MCKRGATTSRTADTKPPPSAIGACWMPSVLEKTIPSKKRCEQEKLEENQN